MFHTLFSKEMTKCKDIYVQFDDGNGRILLICQYKGKVYRKRHNKDKVSDFFICNDTINVVCTKLYDVFTSL